MTVLASVGAMNLSMNVAELLLLHKLEEEFRSDSGHSLRDLADRLETANIAAVVAAVSVADNLAVAQTAVEGVATDLAASHGRADAAEGAPGEASDAASRSPQEG